MNSQDSDQNCVDVQVDLDSSVHTIQRTCHGLVLTLCMLAKNFSRRHFEIFFMFPRKYNLHEVSDPNFYET